MSPQLKVEISASDIKALKITFGATFMHHLAARLPHLPPSPWTHLVVPSLLLLQRRLARLGQASRMYNLHVTCPGISESLVESSGNELCLGIVVAYELTESTIHE